MTDPFTFEPVAPEPAPRRRRPDGDDRTPVVALLVAAVIGGVLGVGAIEVLSRTADRPVEVAVASVEEPTPLAVVRDAAVTTPPPSEAATPAATAEPVPVPRTIAAVGPPARVVIPAIDVDANLVPLGLNPDESMETPDFGIAGWYELGPDPGDVGPAVIAAHVDSVDGPDVFYRLRELEPGDEITVEHLQGGETTFVVGDSEQQRKEELPVDRIWNDTDEVALRLVTCGGEFDREARSYESNVIVYATAEA